MSTNVIYLKIYDVHFETLCSSAQICTLEMLDELFVQNLIILVFFNVWYFIFIMHAGQSFYTNSAHALLNFQWHPLYLFSVSNALLR